MTKEDKYLLGVLWKFGTIKPGTNQFVFQSYDKYDQMEYIRKRLAPDKVIKVSERKDPRSGAVKTLYRLNFTNADWADKVRMYEGVNAEKIIDKDFVRGFLETKATINTSNTIKRYTLSGSPDEIKLTSVYLNKNFGLNDNKISIKSTGSACVSYGVKDVIKLMTDFAPSNPKYWGEILKKMNPDE